MLQQTHLLAITSWFCMLLYDDLITMCSSSEVWIHHQMSPKSERIQNQDYGLIHDIDKFQLQHVELDADFAKIRECSNPNFIQTHLYTLQFNLWLGSLKSAC